MVPEEYLHYVWKFRNFSASELKTTDGNDIHILKPGEHNTNAGPDFLNAQVMIEDTRWAGSVEIHTYTSLWNAHGHHTDKAYDNVILHVVYENDLPDTEKSSLPIFALKDYIPTPSLELYRALKGSLQWIPCAVLIGKVEDITKNSWQDRMLIERLDSKAIEILDRLERSKMDWSETFYRLLARNFGFKVNAEPFERLAESLPQKILARHKLNFFQLEALIFGQSGMIPKNAEDEYPAKLSKEFNFLKTKYNLNPLKPEQWRFMRMRPNNFPTFRLSQFAELVFKSENLFSKILEINDLKELAGLFKLSASEYWEDHYVFDKKAGAKVSQRHIGEEAISNILINTAIPILYAYGTQKKDYRYKERALDFLSLISAEDNAITRKWQDFGLENSNAGNSQALIYLKKSYCDEKRCMDCAIGTKILKSSGLK